MRGIKIPQQDFALKMPGGLMREGGRICGTLRYVTGVWWVVDTGKLTKSVTCYAIVTHYVAGWGSWTICSSTLLQCLHTFLSAQQLHFFRTHAAE